jgi:hypothetical protein
MATSLPRGNNRNRSGVHRTVVSKLVDMKSSDDLVVPNVAFNRCPEPWR